MKANVEWRGKMKFVGTASTEASVDMDAPPVVGGESLGFRPKELMLEALAGCTAMDVISILRKMRCEPESFSVAVEAQETEEHPRVFTTFHIIYRLKGAVPQDKLDKAITLSQERYCGVTAMYSSFASVTHEIILE